MPGFEPARAIVRYRRELQEGLSGFQAALLTPSRNRASRKQAGGLARLRHLALLWLLGAIALAFAAWACFSLKLNFATTGFAFLIVIVLLSLLDSLVSSVIFSIIALGCLNFFFTEPRFTFRIDYAQDLTALLVFVLTSLVVTGLVRRLRTFAATQREQAGLLDLTHDAIFVRDTSDAIVYWNHGAEQLYGWPQREAIGKVTHQLLQTVFPAPLEEIQRALLSTGPVGG